MRKGRKRLTANVDHCVSPIRTYSEVVAIMREQGDATITINHLPYYEKSAFRKLRVALEDLADYFN